MFWKLQKVRRSDDSGQILRISDLLVLQEWVGIESRKQAISNQLPRCGPATRILDKKLPVNVGGGGNSQLPYKSFPFRTLLATEIREIAHCYNFRRRWLPACHWSHLQKPLIGIGAKLFDGVTILRWRAWPRSGRGLWWALSSCHRHTAIKSLRVTL